MKRDAVQDPVCGMRLERADAAAVSEWLGQRHYFCSETCRRSFDANPGRYLERESGTAGRRSVRIPFVGLACAAGDRLPLERRLSRVPGVLDAYVNPVDEAAYLTVDPERFRLEDAEAAIGRLGGRAVGVRSERRLTAKAEEQ